MRSQARINPPAIFLTGPPGVGKSTVIQKLVGQLGAAAGGFYTREIRVAGQRTGFEIVTLTGQTALLATKSPEVTFTQGLPFGQYRVNLAGIDTVGIPALRQAAEQGQVVVIDEIGPMELLSKHFYQAVQDILASRVAVVGAIVQRSHPLADEVKTHPRVSIRPVTLANRNHLAAQIYIELSQWLW
jgi:nucleoside-triphosphatase THEP1